MSATAIANARFAELQVALEEFERIHTEWVDNRNRPYPDATYWDGATALIYVFKHGDMPDEMRAFAAAVVNLSEELAAFDDRENIDNNMPGESFWRATGGIFDLMKQHRSASRPKRLESIKELNDQKVPLWQIAKIYGLIDANGQPMADLVQNELDKPGSVIGKGWVHPDERERREREAERERQRSSLGRNTRRKVEAAKPVNPESCHELWKQKVGVTQAAKMLGRTEEEIDREYQAFDKEAEAEKAKTASQQ